MRKEQVITELQALNLPTEAYVVLMGASLCVRGIRDSGDIDILIDPILYTYFRQSGFYEETLITNGVPCRRFSKGDIEVFDYFLKVGTFSDFTKQFNNVEFVSSIPFVTLQDAFTIKRRFGREKDMLDLALISSFLSKQAFHFYYSPQCCV